MEKIFDNINRYNRFFDLKKSAVEYFNEILKRDDSALIFLYYNGGRKQFNCILDLDIYLLKSKIDINKFEKFEVLPF